jgi:hypothetical protein
MIITQKLYWKLTFSDHIQSRSFLMFLSHPPGSWPWPWMRWPIGDSDCHCQLIRVKSVQVSQEEGWKSISSSHRFLNVLISYRVCRHQIWVDIASIHPYNPNRVGYLRCPRFGHTQHRCASSLERGSCGEISMAKHRAQTTSLCELQLQLNLSQWLGISCVSGWEDHSRTPTQGGSLIPGCVFLENKSLSGAPSYSTVFRHSYGVEKVLSLAIPSRSFLRLKLSHSSVPDVMTYSVTTYFYNSSSTIQVS